MNIGIFVFSKTGNTLSVAEKLRDSLLQVGHQVTLKEVTASNDSEMNPEKIVLIDPPSTQGFDMLVFASPVYGGRLPAVMQRYLRELPSLDGKLAAGFVTQAFPFACLGGNQTIRSMEKQLQAKGAKLSATGVVNRMISGKRTAQIAETVEKITAISQ